MFYPDNLYTIEKHNERRYHELKQKASLARMLRQHLEIKEGQNINLQTMAALIAAFFAAIIKP